jgi:hypothetical protein
LAMLNLNWIEKLKLECIDEPDGTMTIYIEWDENDPELDYWTSLGQEGQEEFIFTALRNACAAYTDTEAFDSDVD